MLLLFSSPEHKVLRVSYGDRTLSVVRRRPSCVARLASSVNMHKYLHLLEHLNLSLEIGKCYAHGYKSVSIFTILSNKDYQLFYNIMFYS